MKILKRIFVFILVIIVIALIAALFVSKEMKSEREIVINKPKQEVFNYIKLLKNQDNYSKWNKMDPNMKKTYTGTDGTVGFTSAWDSENGDVGKGSQTITAIKEGERMDCDLHFLKPFESNAKAYFTTTAVNENFTKVTWAFESKMPYPFNLLNALGHMEKAVGDDFGTGLTNLKSCFRKVIIWLTMKN